jgi:hypothetical protein
MRETFRDFERQTLIIGFGSYDIHCVNAMRYRTIVFAAILLLLVLTPCTFSA